MWTGPITSSCRHSEQRAADGAEWAVMTMNAKRRRAHDRLAALPGVRAVRRPVRPTSDQEFDLFYVRTGRKSAYPLVVIPGGPGAASIALYRGFRRRAAAEGLDVIMVEHRGVGMSRHDDTGADLPSEALTIEQVVDDLAAVLDDAQVDKAVLYGTSYGTYIAAGMGVRHPDRVHAMILDSPVLSADDIEAVREATRRLLWEGGTPETAELAAKVRQLVDRDLLSAEASQLAAAFYGFVGPAVLRRQLDLLLAGRRGAWSVLSRAAHFVFDRKSPYRHEPDLVGRIGYRELNYAGVPDGKPLDPAVAYRELAIHATDFEAEPFDLTRDAHIQLANGGRIRRPRFDHPACGVPQDSVAGPWRDSGRSRNRGAFGDRPSRTRGAGHHQRCLRGNELRPTRSSAGAGFGAEWSRRPAVDLGHRCRNSTRTGNTRRRPARRAPRYCFMKPILL